MGLPFRSDGAQATSRTTLVTASLLSYTFCQVVMITVNKALTTQFGFKAVTVLLLAQNLGLGAILLVLLALGLVRMDVPFRTYVLSIPLCVFYISYLTTGLHALDHLSVPVYTIMKNSCPVFIAVAESIIRGTQHTTAVILSLFGILMGVVVGQDASGSWVSSLGIVWMLLHMLFNVCYVVYTKEFMTRCSPTKLQSMMCAFVTSTPLYLIMVTVFHEWESSYAQARAIIEVHGKSVLLVFAVSVVMGVALTFSIFWVCQQSSALTLAVVGSFNKVPIVITAMLVFGTQLTLRNTLGLAIVCCASLGYAVFSNKYPAHPVPSPWTRVNIAMVLIVALFLTIVVQQASPSSDLCGPAPDSTATSATLAVAYPGSSTVTVKDFVTQYLPSMGTALSAASSSQGLRPLPSKFPREEDPLRLGNGSVVLLLNTTSSPLLHPELLPFLGTLFAEVLVEQNGGLLRVVRMRKWNKVLGGNVAQTETWNVLALKRSPLPPVPSLFVMIDATTALCSPISPQKLAALAGDLCSRRASRRPTSGAAAVGSFVSYPSSTPYYSDADVQVWNRSKWEPVGRFNPRPSPLRYTVRCRAPLDPLGRWPWGLRPLVQNQSAPKKSWHTLPWRGTKEAKLKVPGLVKQYFQGSSSSAAGEMAKCPAGTAYELDALAEAAVVTPRKQRCDSFAMMMSAVSSSVDLTAFSALALATVTAAVVARLKVLSSSFTSSKCHSPAMEL